MEVTITSKEEQFTIQATCPTVITPGKEIRIVLNLTTITPIEIISLNWKVLPSFSPGSVSVQFPLSIGANMNLDFILTFKTNDHQEEFGEIEAILTYRNASSIQNMDARWKHWISVFNRVKEDDAAGLSPDSRKKLTSVVNTRLTNGFLYMADFTRFFNHYLNIEIPEPLATRISKELNLTQEGLPVEEEMFTRIAMGEVRYYGIEKFELIPEEECVESDDRFDPEELREVLHPEINI